MKLSMEIKEKIESAPAVISSFWSKEEGALQEAMSVLKKVEEHWELSDYYYRYFNLASKWNTAVCNILTQIMREVDQFLSPDERVPFDKDDSINVPFGNKRTEKAIIKDIDYERGSCLVQPIRERAEEMWVDVSIIYKFSKENAKVLDKEADNSIVESADDVPPGQTDIFDFLDNRSELLA